MLKTQFPLKLTLTTSGFLLTALASFLFLTSINTVSGNNAGREPITEANLAPNRMMTAPACTDFALLVANYTAQNIERFDGNTGAWQETLVSAVPSESNFVLQDPIPNGPLLISSKNGDIYKYDAFTGAEVGTQPFISAAANGLDFTEQMRIGLDGYLYIVSEDTNNTVKRFNATDGSFVSTFITTTGAHGLVQVSSGDWYLSDNELTGTIKRYDSSGILQSTLYTYTTNEIPRGLTVDSSGDLYVVVKTGGAGGGSARIDKFDLANDIRSVFATLDANSSPFAGIVWGPDNNLYIADFRESEVHVYDEDGTLVRTIVDHLDGAHGIGFSTCIPQTGAIGNYVWLDENSDGYQDAGESGLPNVIVSLTDSSGAVYTTTTDQEGGYLFAELVADTYTVTIPASNSATDGALENLIQSTTQPITAGLDFGNQTTPYPINLGTGEENLTADFGYNWNPSDDVNNNQNNATLGDRIWVDSDGDGVQDSNEIGVEGVTVTLYNDHDRNGIYNNVVQTTTTEVNGYYIFDDLTPDGYVVTVTQAGSPVASFTQTGAPDEFGSLATAADNSTTTAIVLAPGDVFLNADFGYMPVANTTGSIGNTVWFDADADGVGPTINAENQGAAGTPDSDEYGIAGVTVALIQDSDGDGVWDAGEAIIASDISDADGQYLFDGLPVTDGAGSDDYLVWINDRDSVLAGLSVTYDPDGLTSPSTGQVNGAGISAVPDLTITAVTNQDFGYTPISHSSLLGLIGDTIWFDSNGSGTATQDAGEVGIEGVLVNLTNSSGTVITTTTNENGHYYFGALTLTGTHTVTVDASNFSAGGLLLGMSNSYDPDSSTPINTGTVLTLTSGSPINLLQDFSYAANTPGSIGNLIWLDQNANGSNDGVNGPDGVASTDDDETGIPGVTIDLYHDVNANGQADAGEPLMGSSTTDASGNYLFSNLPVDDGSGDMAYVVDVTDKASVLAGYWHSLGDQTQTIDDSSKSDSYPVTLVDGAGLRDVLTVDFGYYVEPAALGNYVWYDENTNGLQDSNEEAISGIPVTLTITYPNTDTITLVTTTDQSGHYSFDNLLLDEDYNGDGDGQEPAYLISVGSPTGYTPTMIGSRVPTGTLNDSDNHSGVVAQPVQGKIDTQAVNPVTNEPLIASYDFGFISGLDFGDLPASYSATQLGDDGPRHTVGSLYLGADVDADGDGSPESSAEGDDNSDGNDDEDGVSRTSGVKWQVGTNGASIDVTVTGTGGFLSLWVDWNQDGDFGEANERALLDHSVTAGNQTITFDVPSGVSFSGDLNLRARLYDGTTAGAARTTGYSGGVGEVEDYQWDFAPLSVNLATFAATCQSSQVRITWETVSELDNLGFNLYRSNTPDGPQSQVNSSFIPSQVPGSGAGAYYEWLDSDIDHNSTYHYWIEDLDTSGTTSRQGPVSATCELPQSAMMQIFIPVIQR